MPRASKEQADLNRTAITEASARLFREHGVDNVSIAELMAAAGLTHGGFYGHFESKEVLAGEACRWAFGRSVERWKKRIGDKVDSSAARAALIDNYLSSQSRSGPDGSCPATSLAGDVARKSTDSPIRASYVAGLEELLKVLASVQETGAPRSDREAALADFATMVGGLMLAKATQGAPISDEILGAARRGLKSHRPARSTVS
jgi:TetR/AcrR family transcriptional regulator, transcriptional repressor for nem operon